MGLQFLTLPVVFHGYEENRGTCRVKPKPATAAECDYNMNQWRAFYTSDWVYGRGTVYTIIILIGACWAADIKADASVIASLVGFLARIDRLPGRIDALNSSAYRRWSALWRSTSYQARVGRFIVAPVTILLLALLTATYYLLMTFAPQPLVWPNSRHGTSPPVATRSGWISLACLPFVLLFATKRVSRPEAWR